MINTKVRHRVITQSFNVLSYEIVFRKGSESVSIQLLITLFVSFCELAKHTHYFLALAPINFMASRFDIVLTN